MNGKTRKKKPVKLAFNGFVKWILFTWFFMFPIFSWVNVNFLFSTMPLWAMLSIFLLFTVGPVSPHLISGKGIFHIFSKDFNINEW